MSFTQEFTSQGEQGESEAKRPERCSTILSCGVWVLWRRAPILQLFCVNGNLILQMRQASGNACTNADSQHGSCGDLSALTLGQAWRSLGVAPEWWFNYRGVTPRHMQSIDTVCHASAVRPQLHMDTSRQLELFSTCNRSSFL